MTHIGGSETKGGFYWKKGAWEIVTIEGENGRLPGGNNESYLRVPGLLVVPLALVISIAYVVFLPVIGFTMLFGAAWGRFSEKFGIAPSRALEEEKQAVPAGKMR